ncbi:hypothetical protein [Alkalicoccobacillus plakortidis]|uniref:DUF1310 family protein n=1 Tax=Alkalicoccobacillus plakortidis TaxID=444060 RepID=A0ABT0XNL8_9BACI|nr:hypothetical protein [Alkalicoccobacillus plakortidis]MCM2677422.1 hypothetical protein [Alkalicoccobacillus plakortidis]
MKKIIVTGIVLIVVSYFSVLNYVIYSNNETTTTGKIVSIMEMKYGTIMSIHLFDNKTNEDKLISEEQTINQFKDELNGIVLTDVKGEEIEEIIYSFSIYTAETTNAQSKRIDGYISSGELNIGDETYRGNGINQVLDVIHKFFANN